MNIEQMKQIIESAPEGATGVEVTGANAAANYLIMPYGNAKPKRWVCSDWIDANERQLGACWPIHALSDLRRIVELEQEVEKLGAMLKDADNYIAEMECDQ